LISEVEPNSIFFAKNSSPLLIAFDGDEVYFASSDTAVIGKAKDAYYLEDGEWGVASLGDVKIFKDV